MKQTAPAQPFHRYLSLVASLVALLVGWSAALATWAITGSLPAAIFFAYLGSAVAVGLGVYLRLPANRRATGRRLMLVLIGTGLISFAAARGMMENHLFQIEGGFFDLLTGLSSAALIHYLLAKIIGPLLFGRVWCGWACWTAMVLDLLPYKFGGGWHRGGWGWVRYAHFGLSLGIVALLWYGAAYAPEQVAGHAIIWFVAGNLLYYLTGIALALLLKDNRAFCKYACPVAVPLKIFARFSLLKVAGNAERCNERHECVSACPMDIRITDYIKHGERVLSTECILCQQCIGVCPEQVLTLSFWLDLGGTERLRRQGEPLDLPTQMASPNT
jgi:polyferredoxin